MLIPSSLDLFRLHHSLQVSASSAASPRAHRLRLGRRAAPHYAPVAVVARPGAQDVGSGAPIGHHTRLEDLPGRAYVPGGENIRSRRRVDGGGGGDLTRVD